MEQKQALLESELAKTKKASMQNGALGAGKSGFTATVFELFAEKLLLLWVSLVTLGFAYPWLKCHYEGFIASKTYVKGRRLSFDGKGKDLAKKYFLWMFLCVVTFGIYSIFLADKLHKWVVEHTHYDANNGGQSSYDGKVGAIFGYKAAAFFAGAFTLGIAKPFVECKREKYLCEHTLIDDSQLIFDGSGGALLKKQVLWVALTIATCGVYAIWLNLQKQQWICACLSNDGIDFSEEETFGLSPEAAEERAGLEEEKRLQREQDRQQRVLEKQQKKQQLYEMRKSPKGKLSSVLFAFSVICMVVAFCLMITTLVESDWVGSTRKALVAFLIVMSCAAVALFAGCIACSAKIKRRALAIASIVLVVFSIGTMCSGFFGAAQITKYNNMDPFFYVLQDDGTYKVTLDYSSYDWSYDWNEIDAKEEKLNKLEGNLVIPSSYKGIPVTAIGQFSSYRNALNERITSITIPDSVTSIDKAAFRGCTGLTSITIPNSVTSIGDSAFYGCTALTSVTIGNGVTSIGGSAFYNCSGLTSITIPNSVTSIGGSAFYNCSGLTSVTIPDSVTSIGDHAFSGCTGLTTVNWNATACTSAGSYYYPIFNGCSNLATVNIGDNVTTIPSYTFYNCTGLTSVTIGGSVTSIGDSAFRDCTGLTTVNWNATACTSAGLWYNPIFNGCSNLATVNIGDNVTIIPSYAFYNCNGLKTVFYAGTEEQWKAISIGSNNGDLISATRFYNHDGVERTYSFVTNCEQSIDPVTATYLSTLPTVTKEGHHFGGWYDNEAFEGEAVCAPYYSKDKTTLYAKWLTEEEWLAGTSFEKAFVAESGKTYDVNITTGGQIVYFAFTPTTSGSFTIQSIGSGDTYGTLYSASQSSLTSNDDGGDGGNFLISYSMTAGETYYIAVRYYSSSTTGSFTVQFS